MNPIKSETKTTTERRAAEGWFAKSVLWAGIADKASHNRGNLR